MWRRNDLVSWNSDWPPGGVRGKEAARYRLGEKLGDHRRLVEETGEKGGEGGGKVGQR